MAAARKPAGLPPAIPVTVPTLLDPRAAERSAGARPHGPISRVELLLMLEEDRRAQAILHRRLDEKAEHAEADAALAVLKYIEGLASRVRRGEP